MNGTDIKDLQWVNVELLAERDTWAAYQNAVVLMSERTRTPSNALLRVICDEALTFLSTQTNREADRWRAAYQRIKSALA